jgi:hypothetical protein
VTVPGESGVLALISHVEILEFLVTTFREQRRLFDDPISELNVGIFDNVVTVQQHARLSEVRVCTVSVVQYSKYCSLSACCSSRGLRAQHAAVCVRKLVQAHVHAHALLS